MFKVSFTMEMIGLELFVSDPERPIEMLVSEKDLMSRIEALNMLPTTTIVNVEQIR